MNKGVLENSPVYNINPNWSQPPPLTTHQPPLPPQIMNPNCFLIPPSQHQSTTSYLPTLLTPSSSSLLSSNPNFSSWLEISDLYPLDHQSWSLSQLLLGGLLREEEESMTINHHHDDDHHQNQYHHYHEKKLENWEEQVLRHQTFKDVKQENNHVYVLSSPIKPSLTTTTTITKSQSNHNIPRINRSLECNNSEIGGSYANKKLKLQVPTNLKVRTEKLGGRIAALHQLVSPFGKTDTASVLSEAIGYIRFLHCQIEALSLPYFGTNSRNNIRQHAQRDINCIFREDPGQIENDEFMKKSKGISSSSLDNEESNPNEEQSKDLRSRGLCLVPISSTLQIGSQSGADYWSSVLEVNFH